MSPPNIRLTGQCPQGKALFFLTYKWKELTEQYTHLAINGKPGALLPSCPFTSIFGFWFQATQKLMLCLCAASYPTTKNLL
jgi:hypothetical protein